MLRNGTDDAENLARFLEVKSSERRDPAGDGENFYGQGQ